MEGGLLMDQLTTDQSSSSRITTGFLILGAAIGGPLLSILKSSSLYLVDAVSGVFNGRIIRDQIELMAMLINAIETREDNENENGLRLELVEKLPKMTITNIGEFSERALCVVCLQEFEVGEMTRCLPYCDHMFHQQCVDMWLLTHGSCPLCRRHINL